MRVLYIGSGDIGLPALRFLLDSDLHQVAGVVTQPDKPAGRRLELTAPPVKRLAVDRGVPILQPVKIRNAEAVEQLRELAPEVIVVMAYGQILPRFVLEIPSVACLNLHASLLPRHRGAAPIQATIEAGDRESGITVMYVDEGLDTGDILLQRSLRVRRRETAGTLHDRLADVAPGALEEALGLLQSGRAPRIPQDPALATYAPKLSRESGRIEWSLPALAIERHVRAMNPWPGAWTTIAAGKGVTKIKVHTVIAMRRRPGTPGVVEVADRHGILVGAGDGSILLRELQPEGKRRMTAAEYLRGNPLATGLSIAPEEGPV